MTKKMTEEERVRKAYSIRGERSQQMMTFRIDNENVDWLQQQRNKGRYINTLIQADREAYQQEPPG